MINMIKFFKRRNPGNTTDKLDTPLFPIFSLLSVVFFLFFTFPVHADNLTYGLKHYIPFDNNSSDIIDGNGLAASGDPTINDTAIINRSYFLDGNDFWGNTTVIGYANGTINFWVKFTRLQASDTIFHKSASTQWYAQMLGSYAMFFDFPTNDVTTRAMTLNEWTMFTFTHDGTNTKVYLNKTLIDTKANTFTYFLGTNIALGCDLGGSTCIQGNLDEYAIWDRPLNQTEIDFMWNNGTGHRPTDLILPNASVQRAIFKPLTRRYSVIPNLTINSSFYAAINYTVAGIANASQQCNFTGYNISAKFRNDNATNVTIGSGAQYSLRISEGNTSRISDRIKLLMCKNGLGASAIIRMNNTNIRNVSAATLPLCANGFHEENFYTNATRAFRMFYINVSCLSCTGSNTLTIGTDTNYNETIKFYRSFSTHSESMNYNVTSKVFDYLSYLYLYERTGNQSVDAQCIGYSETTNFTVLSGSLTMRILSINDIVFSNGTVIEDSNHTSILIDTSGDVIDTIQINLTNATGLLAQSNSEELINYYFPMNGVYNISAWSHSINDQNAYITGYFFVNDTTTPQIFWNFPDASNTSTAIYQTYQQISVSYVDVNLYAYNVTVLDPIGQVVKFFEKTGLINVSGETYTTNMYMNGTGNWTVIAEAVDSHTATKIKEYKVSEDKNTGRIDFETDIDLTGEGDYSNVTIKYNGGTLPLKNVKTTKLEDRYNFDYEFITTGTKPGDKMSSIFRIECKGLDRVETQWKGHLICWDSRTWIDFADVENSLALKKETRCGKDCHEFTFESDVMEKISFNSFGELNHVSETATFEVITTSPVNYTLKWLECPTDEGNLKQLIWLYAVFLAILAAGYLGRSGILCMFAMFGMIGLGFVYIACFEIIGIASIMFGFFTGIYGLYLIVVKNRW